MSLQVRKTGSKCLESESPTCGSIASGLVLKKCAITTTRTTIVTKQVQQKEQQSEPKLALSEILITSTSATTGSSDSEPPKQQKDEVSGSGSVDATTGLLTAAAPEVAAVYEVAKKAQ
eukprot:gene29542-36609_t